MSTPISDFNSCVWGRGGYASFFLHHVQELLPRMPTGVGMDILPIHFLAGGTDEDLLRTDHYHTVLLGSEDPLMDNYAGQFNGRSPAAGVPAIIPVGLP